MNEVYAITDDSNPTAPPVAWVPCPKMARRIANFLFGEQGRIEAKPEIAREIVRVTGLAPDGHALTREDRTSLFPVVLDPAASL